MDWWKLAAIVVAIIVPVGLAIHAAGRARSERNLKRLDDHIAEDVKAHERIAKLEEWRGSAERDISRIAKNIHDLRDRFFQRKE